MEYQDFLESKIVAAAQYGVDIYPNQLSDVLMDHQRVIVPWCISGGRRAIFASFGLGKTLMQLEIAKQVIQITGKPFLICMPLAVVGEFKRDNELLQTGYEIEYITDTDVIPERLRVSYDSAISDAINAEDYEFADTLQEAKNENKAISGAGVDYSIKIYVTNYERVRKGDISPDKFGGVSFDEASILRNLKTETTNYVLQYFRTINFRFVATATPTPNDFIEILNYADFLGVIDRGHALTRFFQRDSTKAGQLKLYENKKDEFWKWVSTWAVFINKPSDLGFDDTGYNLPKLHLHEAEIINNTDEVVKNKAGEIVLFKDTTKSLADTSREKSGSIEKRVAKALEIVQSNPGKRFILWHHLEAERTALEKAFKEHNTISVYGSQPNKLKEDRLIDFSEGKYDILITKPQIAGSGCNFQHACHRMIFVGIDYKFNDFIQAVHRIFRFRQANECHVWMLYTNYEHHVLKTLKTKWANHILLNTEMINLVREYGLNTDKIKADMKRQLFSQPRSATISGATVHNNDTVLRHRQMPDNHSGMILTSIPFGDHYEYSDNYNDFGHNTNNDQFFEQMQFLTPELYRTLKPGRIAAIHVKDRIRYSYQNGTSFTTIDDFSGQTVRHFTKEAVKEQIIALKAEIAVKEALPDTLDVDVDMAIGALKRSLETLEADYKNRFHLVGKITITTDVVRENNQTYRLTWGEQRKDATKMGVGLPEYILLFRKPPSGNENAYADDPVVKKIDDYLLSLWQLDAHAYWKSDGNRLLSSAELSKMDMQSIVRWWKQFDQSSVYDFAQHLQVCEDLSNSDRLSKLFMTLPPHSTNDLVWTDINRMDTLNANQVNRKKEKHICPLQLDIIRRLIYRFTNEGDLVDDPFGGLFSTPYIALQMKRLAESCELNSEYYDDGLFYLKSIEYKMSVPSLFDLIDMEGAA